MGAIMQKIDVDMIKALFSLEYELKELVEFVIKYGGPVFPKLVKDIVTTACVIDLVSR